MKLGQIIKASYFISLAMVLLGIAFKINHYEHSEWLLMAALIPVGTFVISCLYEIRSSDKIDDAEKNMWTIGLIFMSLLVGSVYYFSGRKRVLGLNRSYRP